MKIALIALAAAGIVIGCAVLVLRGRFVAVLVHGDSMVPTLHPGERVLVRRVPLRRVRRGQVVVLAPPPDLPPDPDNPPWMVKRLVALPGDPVPRDLRALWDQAGQAGQAGQAAERVPPGRFVVLGDNTARSFDSRRAGYFPADALLGVVVRTLR